MSRAWPSTGQRERMAGPKQPPLGGRFKKGQSGNPGGRPKKVKEPPASAFDIVIDKTLTVVHNGVPRKLTAEEALQHRTYQDAIGGSRLAQREVLKMIAKREAALAARVGEPRQQIIFRAEPEDNADAALQILGIATDSREGLLLEPWAVQAASARRRTSRREKDRRDPAPHS